MTLPPATSDARLFEATTSESSFPRAKRVRIVRLECFTLLMVRIVDGCYFQLKIAVRNLKVFEISFKFRSGANFTTYKLLNMRNLSKKFIKRRPTSAFS